MTALAHPRWEDFNYVYVDDNPFGWLGDGWTENEKHKRINVDYLNEENIDFPLVVEERALSNGKGNRVRPADLVMAEKVLRDGDGLIVQVV